MGLKNSLAAFLFSFPGLSVPYPPVDRGLKADLTGDFQRPRCARIHALEADVASLQARLAQANRPR
jgi:hypothetical protein